MLKVTPTRETTWTAADLVERFGPIPLSRICDHPAPGQAIESDVLEIRARHKRLFELIDGTLVEKIVGFQESVVAAILIELIGSFVRKHQLGLMAGEGGLTRLQPDLIRIPDVLFVSWEKFPGRKIPAGSFLEQSPDLVVEVISPGNTRQEMDTKLQEYFAKGTRLVWYVYPQQREVHVFTAVDQVTVMNQTEVLSGGEVLPGFELPVKELFADLPVAEDEVK